MAASKTCTQCESISSAVWRTDRETKAIMCNACYLKKYPRPSKPCSVEGAQENGSAPKRQKVIELKTTADPVSQIAQEASREETEEASREELEEASREELEEAGKENVDIKMELKEEIKEEVKEEALREELEEIKQEAEIKAEPEEPVDNSLDDIFGDAMQVKTKKKSKMQGYSVADQDNGAPPEVEVNSDSEYAEVDLASMAPSLIVEASGKSSLDGKYDRMPKACRGRPCYYKRSKNTDKIMYMYWTEQWRLGHDIGSQRCLARTPNVEGLLDCTEPYPHSWKVYMKNVDAEGGTYEEVPALRIFETTNLENQPQLPEPLMEAYSVSADGTAAGAPEQEVSDRKREKKEKKEKKEVKKEAVEEIKQEIKQEADVKKEEAPSTESSSESSSASSDSSDDAPKEAAGDASGSPKKADPEAEKAQQEAKAEAKLAQAEAQKLQKAADFEKKLRSELEKITDLKLKNKKLETITNMLNARRDSLLQAAGLTPDKITILIADLERDFGTARDAGAKKAPRLPGGPPPAHLLKNQDGANRFENAMPSTPPENAGGAANEPLHRTAAPVRGVLKPRGSKGNREVRMSTVAAFPVIDKVLIASFRLAGENLWFQAPGSVVMCDRCERGVPQTMGALQGAPGKSQFAQSEFFCSDCIAGSMVMPG